MATKKKQTEKLTRCSGTLTESAYLAWIRSALRAKSLRWKPRTDALQLARRPYKGPNKRQQWEYQCALCKAWHKADDVIVDHFPHAAGSILSVEDIGPFAERLFCEVDNLRVLDKVCHDIHTLSEKLGMSFADAQIEKEVIDICKRKAKDVVAFCLDYGYNATELTNPEKRRKAVQTILRSV